MSMYSNPVDIAKLKDAENIIKGNMKFIVMDDDFYYALKDNRFADLTLVDGFKDKEKGAEIFKAMTLSFEFTH